MCSRGRHAFVRYRPLSLSLRFRGRLRRSTGEDTGSGDQAQSTSADNASIAYGPCGYTRAELIAQVSASRGDAITRGFEWYDDKVPFNKAATHDKYRTDCSGFVSMCWQLGAPGKTTSTLARAARAPRRSRPTTTSSPPTPSSGRATTA